MISPRGAGRPAGHRIAGRRRPGVLAGFCSAVAVAGSLLAGCGAAPGPTAPTPAEPAYGSLPTFLPNSGSDSDSMLTGTAAHPALTTEGDVVQVSLDSGASVQATVAGPEVPGEGLPFQGPATTCTWTVTLTAATTSIPVGIGDFSAVDHLGAVYHPTLAPGQPKLPSAVLPGQRITFELRAVMRTGEGLMRWAPRNSLLASWDFEVEND